MSAFSKAMFVPLIGQTFLLYKPDGTHIRIKLTNIDESHISNNYESFSLNFEAPKDEPALADDSYLIENDKLGRNVIFLSATLTADPDPNNYYYESVFNIYKEDQ
ncbi:MAG: hypothetical protein PVI90_20280 [Desulfobacteraceae bacterium]|jgi:hypothetical protein